MPLENMASKLRVFKQNLNVSKLLINFMRIFALWLCARLDIPVTPDGCRPIPAGHMNFDPALAKALGGKDGVNIAIVFQYLANWIAFNQECGKNYVDERFWTYNSARAWADDIGLWHEKTIRNYLNILRKNNMLDAQAIKKHRGDQTLWYSLTKDSNGGNQMPLCLESNAGMTTAKVPNDSSISQASNQQSTIRKPQQQRKRADAHLSAGGVAQFPKRNLDPKEAADLKPEIRDVEPSEDGSGEDRTPPPVAPAPSPAAAVPAWMPLFFTGCTPDELLQMVQQFGEPLLKQSKAYAENEKHGIKNPPAFVRAQLEKGWRPPVDPAADETPTKPDLDWDTEKQVVWGPPPEPETPECAIWKRAYGQLEIQLDRASFDTWVRSARFLRCEGDTYVVGVANNYAREMLQHRLYRDIQRLVRNVADAEIQLQFEVYERVPVADEEIPLFRLLARQAEVK